jgi:hypothetical protein
MQIENKKFYYCKTCKRTHKKMEKIEICSVCQSHITNSYDLQIHTNLSLSSDSIPGQRVSCCQQCIETLHKMGKREDPWISAMMGYDEY